MKDVATLYAGFLGRVDAQLDCRGYALESQDVEYGWYAAFIIGMLPSDAVDQALADQLLRAHAAAWWRDIEALDFVEQVNTSYDAYLAGGGSDAHYDAHWRAMSDAAKAAAELLIGETA